MQAPPAWAILAAIGASGGLAGLVWFGQVDGEAVWLGETLLAASATLVVAVALALWRPPRTWWALVLLLPALVLGVVGSWACWVAGIEGRCHLFG